MALNPTGNECTESCKSIRRDLENSVKQLKSDLRMRDEKILQMEKQAESSSPYRENIGSTHELMSALNATEEKNTRLENCLSAVTRLKLELFAALGEAKRQHEITQTKLVQKEKEIEALKSEIAEVTTFLSDF